jgi:hypothetical protein
MHCYYLFPDSGYFAIDSTTGRVTVQQQLPLGVATMTYKVYARDGGGLVANFTLTFTINGK